MEEDHNEEIWNVLAKSRVLSICIVLVHLVLCLSGLRANAPLYGQVSSRLTGGERIWSSWDGTLTINQL